MSDTNQEVLAALRIIGAVARADGSISKDERAFFGEAATELQPDLPEGVTIEALLDNPNDLKADLETVVTPAIRRVVFDLAVSMSKTDGVAHAENDVLKQIREAFSNAEAINFETLLKASSATALVTPTLNADERASRVKRVIAQRAQVAGICGAIPIPFVSDVGVLIQMSAIIDDLGTLWGQPLTSGEKWARFGVILSLAMAQGAVHSLIKLIPGWGTLAGSVSGAVASYAVVGAVGRAVNFQFERDGKATPEELKQAFRDGKAEMKKQYEGDKAKIDAARTKHADDIAKLAKQLEAKEITNEEYDQKMAAFLGE